jgi:hypothetical protein
MVRELEWQTRVYTRGERVFERVCANETALRAVAEASNAGRRQGSIAGWLLHPLPLECSSERKPTSVASQTPRAADLRPFRTTGAYVTGNMTYTAFPAHHHRVIAPATPFFAKDYRMSWDVSINEFCRSVVPIFPSNYILLFYSRHARRIDL